MRLEVIFFRAYLLLFATSLIGFGSLAIHFDRKSSSWGELVILHVKHITEYDAACREEIRNPRSSAISCDLLGPTRKRIEEAKENASSFDEKAELFTTLAWAVPLFFTFAFYGGRWVVSGRVRPLWPVRESE